MNTIRKLAVSLGVAMLSAVAFGQNPVARAVTPGPTLPATCTVGDRFFKTTATAGQNEYGCTATNTWTLQSGSGSPAGYTTVTYSATPTFTASSTTGTTFLLTLTGNVTSSTLAGAATGQIITFRLCQNGTGPWAFVWPVTVLNGATISAVASSCTNQTFIFDGTNAQAIGIPIVTGITGSAITMPGSTSGSTTVQPSAVASGTLTLPAATDTLIGKATTDVLLNKTIDTAGPNTIKIAGTSLTAVSGTGSVCLSSGSACSVVPISVTMNSTPFDPADSTTYYWSPLALSATACGSAINAYSVIVPVNGTITEFYATARIFGTLGTAENVTYTLMKNCVATALTMTQQWTSTDPALVSDIAHTAAVTKGDLLQLRVVTPAWATNPTQAHSGPWAVSIAQ